MKKQKTNEKSKAYVSINGHISLIEHDNNESSMWQEIAKLIYESGFKAPSTISVNNESGNTALVEISVKTDSSISKNSISIQLLKDKFKLPKSVYKQVFLRHIDAEKNIRMRYDFNPNNMGQRTISVGVISGEIGKKGFDKLEDGIVHKPFPSQLFWIRYYLKIHEGFKDYTDSLMADEDEDKVKNYFKLPSINQMTEGCSTLELYTFLANSAKDNLSASGIEIDFFSNTSPYTKRQVVSAKKLYNKMCEVSSVEEMNILIDDLIAIAMPKYEKGTTVKSFYVKTVKDLEKQKKVIADKLDWVNSVVSSMEAVFSFTHTSQETYQSPFGDVKIYKETAEEMEETITGNYPSINKMQSDKIVAIYRISPTKQIEKYENHLTTLNKKSEMMLFHGSPNCNWISIISNGLLLKPNAQICGKAYGNGSYFAPDSDKSAGYVSSKNSYWRGGSDPIAVMGIYRVATGNTYNPKNKIIGGAPEKTDALLKMFNEKGYDSLHYCAGTGTFVRDEIVVYNESASCINKLILYKA